jgi:hypothetical protein
LAHQRSRRQRHSPARARQCGRATMTPKPTAPARRREPRLSRRRHCASLPGWRQHPRSRQEHDHHRHTEQASHTPPLSWETKRRRGRGFRTVRHSLCRALEPRRT